MTATTTSTATRWVAGAIFAAATTLALQVGTGGSATESYYKLRGEKGYAFKRYTDSEITQVECCERTPSQDLTRIREVLKSSVTDLANLFRVSRQAIYDWQAGNQIAQPNADRLRELAIASDIIAAEGLENPVYALRRKLRDGKSFFDIVREGGDALGAADAFVMMVRKESNQRAQLDEMLGGRKNRKIGTASLGVPMLSEEG